MKVSELISELQKLDQDKIVILQKDGEGNGYSPLSGSDEDCVYQADSTWSGVVYSTDWTADEALIDEDEWESFKKNMPGCVVLFPIN